MPRVPTTPFPFLLAAALATALMPGRPARAGIVLAVGNPQFNGVVALDGTQADLAPASDSPAHAIAGNARSSLRLLGAQMALSFEVAGSGVASTGFNPSLPNFGAIPISIEGTSGEAAGSPVILQLQGSGNVPPDPGHTDLFVNNTLYSANQPHAITNFSVGDQFYFWGGLAADGNGDYIMTVTLSVQAAGGSAVPEPSSRMLMSAGLVPMLVAWLRRRREQGCKSPGAASWRFLPSTDFSEAHHSSS